jgi:hypothetical protein
MYEDGEPHFPITPAEMTETPGVDEADVSAAPVVDAESSDVLAKAGWAVALGGVAAVSKWAEYKGMDHGMEAPERWVTDSAAHPLIGYMGAWAADMATTRFNPLEKVKVQTAWLGATAANFATEGIQSVTIAASQFVDFWSAHNRMETSRDYVGALAGLVFYLWRDRRRA